MLGSPPEAETLLAQLVERAGAEPAETALTHGSYRETKRHLSGEGGIEDGHIYTRSEFFARPLPDTTTAALVEHVARGRVAGEARELDFSPWGGAYNRTPAGATAFPHRDARFLLKHAAVVDAHADPPPRARLGHHRVGDRPPVRNRRRLPELPRPRARRPGAGVLRSQPRARQAGRGDIRGAPDLSGRGRRATNGLRRA